MPEKNPVMYPNPERMSNFFTQCSGGGGGGGGTWAGGEGVRIDAVVHLRQGGHAQGDQCAQKGHGGEGPRS